MSDKPNFKSNVPPQRQPKSTHQAFGDLWRQDHSLERIGTILENESNKVLSLDFFDTLVGRLCASPTDLFAEVGRRLAADGLLTQEITTTEFARVRAFAEQHCRQQAFWQRGSNEIDINDIYRHLNPHWVSDVDKGVEIEIQVECDWCFQNPSVYSLMQFALNRGHRVIVISDMYLHPAHLVRIANQNGIDLDPCIGVLTSCDSGGGKIGGGIFRAAIAALGTSAANWHHLGDNKEADVEGPALAGAHGHHYYRQNDQLTDLYTAEKRQKKEHTPIFSANAIRTLCERNHQSADEAFRIGATIIGPVLSAYADWAARSIFHQGIRTVLAFMREGKLLGELVTKSARAQGLPLTVLPAFVSRQATHLAGLHEATMTSIPERMYSRNVGECLNSFDINPSKAGIPKHISELTVQNVEMYTTIVQFLSKGQIKKTIEKNAAERRAALLSYIGELIGTDKEVACLDLGWGGTIQRNIVAALEAAGLDIKLHGYYLANSSQAFKLVGPKSDVHGFLSHLGDDEVFTQLLVRSPEMLEQSVNAAVGSTLGYTFDDAGHAQPVLGPYDDQKADHRLRIAIQAGIRHYQNQWLDIATRKNLFERNYDVMAPGIKQEAKAIIHRLIAYPTVTEARTLGQFEHDDGLFSEVRTPICNRHAIPYLAEHGYADMLYAFRHQTKKHLNPRLKLFWPQSLLALHSPSVIRELALGTEYPRLQKSLGKITSSSPSHSTAITPRDIVQIQIITDDWTYYLVDINCPTCHHQFSEEMVGTPIVSKLITCTHCASLYKIDYDVISQTLSKRVPALIDERVDLQTTKLVDWNRELNESVIDPHQVPLLAQISCEPTMALACELLVNSLLENPS